jgi:anhydro-N-acetylmuramic acid kinase
MSELYLGIMSGTSLDAIDAVVADFTSLPPKLIACHTHPLPDKIRSKIIELHQTGVNELERMAQLDIQLGRLFAEAVMLLLEQIPSLPHGIQAIGSHGQTIRHQPAGNPPYTLQIGDPNIIAQLTGITTVADFRRRDIAAGGQGAPLVPAFHAACFHSSDEDRVIVNIGGMANITILPAREKSNVSGFDTGPGNVLLDGWIRKVRGEKMDESGNWARSGKVDIALLQQLLDDPYFRQPPPKSTGREYFNLEWLENRLTGREEPQDIQATLCELTAVSIAKSVSRFAAGSRRLLVCGGGSSNNLLMDRLQALLSDAIVESSHEQGIPPHWVEATAFAWLARQTLKGLTGNIPAVTGAKAPVVLGGIYPA